MKVNMRAAVLWALLTVALVPPAVVGASDEGGGATGASAAEPACRSGGAVADPSSNSRLVRDCGVLLTAKDGLRGTGSLNWSASTAITSWDGVTVSGTPQRVTALRLPNSSLTGIIPWELGGLSELTVLDLSGNSLTGSIPRTLGLLSGLTSLSLNGNMLTGSIPPALGGLTNVTYFNLAANRLTGSIPSELGSLSSVEELSLRENQLSGSIPSELGGLTMLEDVDFRRNSFTECVPVSLRRVPQIRFDSSLSYCNSPPVFESSEYEFSVREDAGVGDAVGSVLATDVDEGDVLSYSIVFGNDGGAYSMATSTITVARGLDYETKGKYALTVVVNDGAGGRATTTAAISVTNVGETCSEGVAIPNPSDNPGLVRDCEALLAGKDTLQGNVPPDTNSEPLNWSPDTLMTGWSPDTPMMGWSGVVVGGTPKRVEELLLDDMDLRGSIPAEIGHLEKLLNFMSRNNRLSGEIPKDLEKLRSVRQIIIKGDPTGDPTKDWLSGRIPPELGNLRNLTVLILRRNQLSGEIPPELGKLTNLDQLNLTLNRLSGELPPELGNLTGLGILGLFDDGDTGNKFVGCIPAGLRNVGRTDAPQSGLPYCNGVPVFSSSEYAFSVREDADVGDAVGSVSATDIDEEDTLSYSIVSGNDGGAFSMATNTGAITVARGLDYETKRKYALTVVVNDGAGGRATTTAAIGVTNVVDVCLQGVAVPSPTTNYWLAGDCEALLRAKDALRGTAALNWSTSVAMTEWDGVTVSGTPNQVTGLVFRRPTIGELSEMSSSERARVMTPLTGSIPPELGELSGLTRLDFTRNSLTGSIPPEIGELTNLTYFGVGANRLSGEIPSELGNLANLTDLVLEWNRLSGEIPLELAGLSNLQYLLLRHNQLTGDIPAEIGGLKKLSHLYVAGNRFTGCVPPELRNIANNDGRLVGLPYCSRAPVFMSGEYTFSVGEDASVGDVVGSVSATDANLGDPLSYSVVSGDGGEVFSMAAITGKITLVGELDYETKRRYTLTVQVSDGRGETAIATVSIRVTNVADVCLGSGAVSGSTTNLGLAHDCEVLLVAADTLRGTRRLNWDKGGAMTKWDGVTVSGTPLRVTGLDLTNLELRDLTGSIPPELGELDELTVLNLSTNSLTGSIPPELGELSKLTHLRLSRNALTGSIPPELGSLTNVTYFNLAVNRLTGSIPPELGGLTNVEQMWLKENWLSGPLPSELSRLKKLRYLKIWFNNLTGEIPQELGGLPELQKVSFGTNNLTGCVPIGWRREPEIDVNFQTGLSYCHPAPGTPGIVFEDSLVRVHSPSVTGATSYEVELSADGSTRTTSCTHPWWCSFTALAGQSYTARVRYTKSGTLSEWSTSLEFTFSGFLASDSVSTTRSGNSITVEWTPALGGVVSQRVRLLYTNSGCNFGDRAWDGPNHLISDGTTSSHTFTNVDLSSYTCIFPLVYNYFSTGYTFDYGPTFLGRKAPTPRIEINGSSVYVIPDELPGVTSYQAELSGDGSTRTLTCTYTWGCSTFTGRVGQSYTARVRYSTGPGAFTNWSESKAFTLHGFMPSGSVSATRSGSSVTVDWTPVAAGVVSQRVVLTFTTSGCSLSDRIWSDFSQDFADGTTRTHTFTNVDLSKYTCIFPLVYNYFASDKTVITYRYGSGVSLTSSGGAGGASGASGVAGASGQAEPPVALQEDRETGGVAGASGQAEPPTFDPPLEAAPQFEFDRASYAFSVGEDAGVNTLVGVVRASGPDGAAESYSITAGNEDRNFDIGTTSGEITVVVGLDYETTTSYTLTVEARDSRGGAATATVEVAVIDVAESSVSGAGPRDLVADASSESVTLRWSAPEDPAVTGYRVLRRRAQVDDVFVSLAEVVATSTPMYVDTRDVTAGTQYIYRVVAVYDGVDGSDARVSVAIPLPGPRGLVADASSESVTLRWSAPEDPAVTGYRVLRRRAQVDDAFIDLAEVVATSTPMYVDTRDVATGTQYIYRVLAVYDGVDGGDARVVAAIPLPGPRGLVAEASLGSVTLRWSAPEGGGVTEYRVLRRRAQVDDVFVSLAEVVATSTPMYVDTRDVAAGTNYIYRVVAVYDGVDGGDARAVAAIPLPGPRDLVAAASSESVTLRWSAPEDPAVTGYRVLRRRAQVDDAFVSLAEVVATSTPMYVDTRDVAAGAQYIYRVVAVYDGADVGDARVSVVIPLPGPRDLVADASSESVTLRWSAPEDPAVTGYRVLRRRAQLDDVFIDLAEVVATSTPMYVDTRDVAVGAQYIYRVVAVYDGVDGGDARVAVTTPSLALVSSAVRRRRA